jgi:integrating conjugative element protein (TIGR03746 family)
MRRYRYEIDNVRSHLRSLWILIVLLTLMLAGWWFAWMRLPSHLTVHIPPDLRSGAELSLDEVPPANVYTFAFYIMQQLNRWPVNGADEYGKAIFRVSAYLTPKFREQLIADLQAKARAGELARRTRSLQVIAGAGYTSDRVDIVTPDQWVIWLDLELVEHLQGMIVKRTRIRYPVRVVRYAVDAEANPWGLALDGYAANGPQRINSKEES